MSKKNRILLVMTVSMTLGYMPWYNFSAVLKYLADEFHLSASDTGWILAAFQAGYVIVVGVTGWLGDRLSLKKIVFWATLITGIFSTLFVWGAQGKESIIVLRLITGLSAGAIYVPGMALLSQWFPPKERGGALGALYRSPGRLLCGRIFNRRASGRRLRMENRDFMDLSSGNSGRYPDRVAGSGCPAGRGNQGRRKGQRPEAPGKAPAEKDRKKEEILEAPPGGYKGPAFISASYMGHMWELYAFWGWIGPFLVSAALTVGMAPDEAVKWGGTFAAAIILIGAPASWGWGIVADRKGRTWAIMVASILSAVAECFLGYLYGHSLAVLVLLGCWIGFWVIADSAIYKAGLTEMVLPRIRSTSLGHSIRGGFFRDDYFPAGVRQNSGALQRPRACRSGKGLGPGVSGPGDRRSGGARAGLDSPPPETGQAHGRREKIGDYS